MKLVTCAIFTVALIAPVTARQMQHDKMAMDHRGHQAMGWDQSKATHTFASSSDGGSIEVAANDAADTATVAAIRTHLAEIAKSFKAGDFDKPAFIHAQTPPGVEAMKRLRGEISYRYEETPKGGKVSIATKTGEAVSAVHAFLKFQQDEHGMK